MTDADPSPTSTPTSRLPRLGGLWLSPDGRRLVVGVATPDRKNTRYAPRCGRSTRTGDAAGAAADPQRRGRVGGGLHARRRPAVHLGPAGARRRRRRRARAALWLLPAGGGDARVVATRPAACSGVRRQREPGRSWPARRCCRRPPTRPTTRTRASSARTPGSRRSCTRSTRCGSGTTTSGPDRPRLLVADAATATATDLELRDLTGHAGRALDEDADWDITPDGRTVVATWTVAETRRLAARSRWWPIDVATGERRVARRRRRPRVPAAAGLPGRHPGRASSSAGATPGRSRRHLAGRGPARRRRRSRTLTGELGPLAARPPGGRRTAPR